MQCLLVAILCTSVCRWVLERARMPKIGGGSVVISWGGGLRQRVPMAFSALVHLVRRVIEAKSLQRAFPDYQSSSKVIDSKSHWAQQSVCGTFFWPFVLLVPAEACQEPVYVYMRLRMFMALMVCVHACMCICVCFVYLFARACTACHL